MRVLNLRRNGFALFGSLWLAALLAVMGYAVSAQQVGGKDADVLSLGGSVTEIIVALDQGHRLLARDTTSSYPPEVQDLPDVGYVRALSPEGVLSVGPGLILAEEGAGPPEALDVIRNADVAFAEVPAGFTAQAIADKIAVIGDALNVPDRAATLASKVMADMQAASDRASARADQPMRVMFVLSTQGGRIMASGTGTGADAVIRLAGGVNAVTEFQGYKQIGDEAVGTAAPDVILMMDHEGDHAVADDELFAMPAIRLTPAAEARSVLRMDGLLLLGFGPRTAQAVEDLSRALYGDGA
ncbi:heme/hemin ABC transporter substrate-binding protein [Lacimonas salitolerans]|uniref:Hemin ABC transporter substrate-binding protein n=1 Tax=Lacimonas salitolerans TaxID=1323750 RepID=A0ABW4EDR7_9RHOB